MTLKLTDEIDVIRIKKEYDSNLKFGVVSYFRCPKNSCPPKRDIWDERWWYIFSDSPASGVIVDEDVISQFNSSLHYRTLIANSAFYVIWFLGIIICLQYEVASYLFLGVIALIFCLSGCFYWILVYKLMRRLISHRLLIIFPKCLADTLGQPSTISHRPKFAATIFPKLCGESVGFVIETFAGKIFGKASEVFVERSLDDFWRMNDQ